MAKLFGKNHLREIAQKIHTDEVTDYLAIVKTWHNDFHKGSLKSDKETSREQAYNQDFFIKILGYREKPAAPFSFEPKATTESGQLPDAVISYTDDTKDIENIAAVVELKGASVELDRPQRRDGNLSPVQQGFKYKTQYRHCPFVIVSNFWEFRLYHDNLLDYEVWTLDDLVNPADDHLLFKTWYVLLKQENFSTNKGASKTENLLSDIRVEQEEIGKKFYQVYKQARLDLLRDIYQHNAAIRSDIDLGIQKAQKIIDRIVFACFAEDRGLLPDNTLPRVIQAADGSAFGGSIWSTLKSFFEAIDSGSAKLEIPDGYNGGLFARDEVLNNLQIGDEPLRCVLELGKYNFVEDLSVNILGHIFEQSISDLEEIKNKVHESQNLETLNLSRRKKDGIFYTPDYIVRYIVENSLGVYLREHEESLKLEFGLKGDINDKSYEKREKQTYLKYFEFVKNVKVVDPACGSGAFLVQVFDYLYSEYVRVGKILGLDKGVAVFEDVYKNILQNNIYGVDLNAESVEITKLSLWLKSAQKGKKLTVLDGNIKCGNSLINDPEVAGDRAFDWNKEFADIMAKGGFDVVVGNPPYVRQELLGDQKPYLETHYKVFAGTTDLFAYFYEKAIGILKPRGLMSFISNSFAKTTGAGVVLRRYLQENTQFEQLLDFGTLKVFEGATTYPIILVLRKAEPQGQFQYFAVEKQDLGSLDAGFRAKAFKVDQRALTPESWIFENKASQKLRDKIRLHSTVTEQYGKSYYGIKTGFNEAFIIDARKREELIAANSHGEELIKPFWEGIDITRWSSTVEDKFVIVIKQGDTGRLFGEVSESDASEQMMKKYPAVMAHLVRYEADARARYDKGDFWWEMRACAYYEHFEKPKITWPNLQARGKFCFDDSGKYINAPAVILPSANKALLAILNSNVVWYFLTGVCVVRSGGYIEVKPQYFAQIPVPKIVHSSHDQLEKLATIAIDSTKDLDLASERFQGLVVNEFGLKRWPTKLAKWWTFNFVDFVSALKLKISLQQKDELLELFEKYQKECFVIDEKIMNTEKEINQLVYKLYELTDQEIAIIESV